MTVYEAIEERCFYSKLFRFSGIGEKHQQVPWILSTFIYFYLVAISVVRK